MEFTNKAALIEFVKKQTGVHLDDNATNCLNCKRGLLYTEIARTDQTTVLRLFRACGIRYEHHVGNCYFVHVK